MYVQFCNYCGLHKNTVFIRIIAQARVAFVNLEQVPLYITATETLVMGAIIETCKLPHVTIEPSQICFLPHTDLPQTNAYTWLAVIVLPCVLTYLYTHIHAATIQYVTSIRINTVSNIY